MTGGQHPACSDPIGRAEAGLTARLVTPQTLVAQAVASALRSRGIVVIDDPVPQGGSSFDPEVLLIIDDLVTPDDVRRVLALVRGSTRPVLVLTGRERGLYWGALFSAGAASVMSSSAGLDVLVTALTRVSAGVPRHTAEEREELAALWVDYVRELQLVVERLNGLTPRERGVLAGLCGGDTVSDIAVDLSVREATVRSHVKSILRKLGVRTQLAAVARAQDIQSPLVAGATRLAPPLLHSAR